MLVMRSAWFENEKNRNKKNDKKLEIRQDFHFLE